MDMGGQNQLFAELRNALSEADVALSALRVSHRTGVTTFAHAKALANYRRVVELVQSGAIGGVTEAHVWVHRAWGRQSPEDAKKNGDIVTVLERPEVTETNSIPPAGLDWDLWLGPAPQRPYHPAYHPTAWRCWWDFGNGMMGDPHWGSGCAVCAAVGLRGGRGVVELHSR